MLMITAEKGLHYEQLEMELRAKINSKINLFLDDENNIIKDIEIHFIRKKTELKTDE